MPDAAAVAAKLRESGAHHAKYRQCSTQQDLPNAIAHVRNALAARLDAADMDPERTAPVWVGERVVHDEMVRFYHGYLERAEARGLVAAP